MTKSPNKRQIIRRFAEEYAKKFIKIPDITQLITNLIIDGVTDPERLRNYMIVQDYYKKLEEHKGHVTRSTLEISDEYEISERQVQNVIYKWREKYLPVNNIED